MSHLDYLVGCYFFYRYTITITSRPETNPKPAFGTFLVNIPRNQERFSAHQVR